MNTFTFRLVSWGLSFGIIVATPIAFGSTEDLREAFRRARTPKTSELQLGQVWSCSVTDVSELDTPTLQLEACLQFYKEDGKPITNDGDCVVKKFTRTDRGLEGSKWGDQLFLRLTDDQKLVGEWTHGNRKGVAHCLHYHEVENAGNICLNWDKENVKCVAPQTLRDGRLLRSGCSINGLVQKAPLIRSVASASRFVHQYVSCETTEE